MINFKKVFNLLFIQVFFVAMVMLNSMAYGAELPIDEKLRIPLGFSSASGETNDLSERFGKTAESMSKGKIAFARGVASANTFIGKLTGFLLKDNVGDNTIIFEKGGLVNSFGKDELIAHLMPSDAEHLLRTIRELREKKVLQQIKNQGYARIYFLIHTEDTLKMVEKINRMLGFDIQEITNPNKPQARYLKRNRLQYRFNKFIFRGVFKNNMLPGSRIFYADINELLKRSLLDKYPVITVLRRMRHGGSVYDMEARINTIQFIELLADECSPPLSDELTAFHKKLKDAFSTLRTLVNEPPKNLINIPSRRLKDWEARLEGRLEAFKNARAEFAGLKGRMLSESSDKEMAETMADMFEKGMDEWVSILEQGTLFTKGVVLKQEMSLKDAVQEVISPYSNFVEFKNQPDINVYADPMMVRQMITNIIVNADVLKNKMSITKVYISIKLSEDGKEAMINITDNGLGFDKNMLNDKQEPDGGYEVMFSYGRTYREGGSGFGLAENDLYARLHKGSFRIFSRPSGEQRGSTFIIRLPVSSDAQDLNTPNTIKETLEAVRPAMDL